MIIVSRKACQVEVSDFAPSMQRDGHLIVSSRNSQLSKTSSLTPSNRSPVLLDVEGPLELQMGLVVVVDELGDGLVVAAAEHAGGRGLGLDCAMLVESPNHSIPMMPYISSRKKASPRCWVHSFPRPAVSIMTPRPRIPCLCTCNLPSSPASCCSAAPC
jgi:hypothetical protein